MVLPSVPLRTATVDVEGTKVEVRGLSRSEAVDLQKFVPDVDKIDTWVLACGTGVSVEEADEWRKQTPSDTVSLLVDRIGELSGFGDDEKKE
jgi:hypothetical protein